MFRWLIQVFHFTGRKWHLPSPSRSQCSQLGQASFSPAPGARKHRDLHLVTLKGKEHSQQSTGPTCFKEACLTWFTASLIQCLSILWFQSFNCELFQGLGCSWVMMLRTPNPRTAAAPSVMPTTSMGRNQPAVCYKLVLGGCPQAQRQLDPCLLPPQLMFSQDIDKLNNLQKNPSMCFTSVHPLSVLTVLHHKKKRE